MAALMKQRQVMVYTHDSIGLGEDGPTHQPVEQVASLRVTPNMSTWRPCDQVESAIAWKYGVERQDGPTALILSRQNLAQQERTAEQLANVARGGYVLKDCAGQPELIFIATGSEVELAVAAWGQTDCRRREGARGFHAVHRRVRQAGCGLSRIRTAESRDRARCRGSGYR
ncbi:transketolase [Klebsiella pneumoniae]|uniref:Transketolase n=1 Tax=Klebsiella pneumoniae TaxID=573 RepID=A0A377W7T9_KLEPN|nr:transketolase [Klebsiella pneumoniae]